jgi:hypothetical protein
MIKSNFFVGVVEDINDPSHLGRVKVRSMDRTSDKIEMPTETLPWALVTMPSNQSSMSGYGWSPTGILPGTWVVGFYQDGDNSHSPIVLGTISGMATAPDTTIGFSDPSGTYPIESRLDEPDVNRLARGESEWLNPNTNEPIATDLTESIHTLQKDALITGIKSAEEEWNQPEPSYAAVYPNNKVFESISGHVIEIDDTPEAERIFVHHKSGTFIEIMPDGSINQQINATDYKITLSDKNLLVKGNLNITCEGNTNLTVNGNVTEDITGNITRTVAGDLKEDISGDVTRSIGGSLTEDISSDCNLTAGGNTNIKGSIINLN